MVNIKSIYIWGKNGKKLKIQPIEESPDSSGKFITLKSAADINLLYTSKHITFIIFFIFINIFTFSHIFYFINIFNEWRGDFFFFTLLRKIYILSLFNHCLYTREKIKIFFACTIREEKPQKCNHIFIIQLYWTLSLTKFMMTKFRDNHIIQFSQDSLYIENWTKKSFFLIHFSFEIFSHMFFFQSNLLND